MTFSDRRKRASRVEKRRLFGLSLRTSVGVGSAGVTFVRNLKGLARRAVQRARGNGADAWAVNRAMIPSNCTVLVLAPHPDDEAIGCGGTVRMLADAGGKVVVAFLTSGDQGFAPGVADRGPEARRLLGETRRQEAEAACRILGVAQTHFIAGSDGDLAGSPWVSAEIEAMLSSTAYDLVLAPWCNDRHRDHRSAFLLLQRAARRCKRPLDFWLYEVWTPLWPNVAVDISAVMDSKIEAIRCYASQLHDLNYVETATGLSRFRSVLLPGATYAEAFTRGSAKWLATLRGAVAP